MVRVGRRPVSGSLCGDRVWAQNDRRQELMAELRGNAICWLENARGYGVSLALELCKIPEGLLGSEETPCWFKLYEAPWSS